MRHSKAKQKGRDAGLKIVQRTDVTKGSGMEQLAEVLESNRVDVSPIVEALKTISDHKMDLSPILEGLEQFPKENIDLSPIVEAIQGLDGWEIDLSGFYEAFEPLTEQLQKVAQRETVNLKPVIDKLDLIAKAMRENNKILSELVEISKKSKTVVYDNAGRITEIKVSI